MISGPFHLFNCSWENDGAGVLILTSAERARYLRQKPVMLAGAALALPGAALLISTLIWVRSVTGWLVLPAVGIAIPALAARGPVAWPHFGIQFLGVQASISVWQQFGYLFSTGGVGPGQLSDTAAGWALPT
ncbi:M50 family metallopeptidase [Croceicoccus sediminis]|uniref:M50 family metallopeptidase n=1 Tax=Croceicoccus sediminis TaxID=2571150 RepID=UPI001183FE2C|nr:M50 family metallopeptidase [Croceicoccus sediminis]